MNTTITDIPKPYCLRCEGTLETYIKNGKTYGVCLTCRISHDIEYWIKCYKTYREVKRVE